MLLMIIGIVIFLGIHSIQIFTPQIRENFIEKHGKNRWRGLYSVFALVGLGMLIYGFGLARVSEYNMFFWSAPTWFTHIMMLLMLPAIILLVAGDLPKGRIVRAVKNPMVIGVKTWAFAHLLVNGDLASVLLFGSFLVWTVLLVISYKKRGQTRPEATSGIGDILAVVIGIAVWAAIILWLHEWLIGVPIIA